MSESVAEAHLDSVCAACLEPLQQGAAFCRTCGTTVSGRVIAPPDLVPTAQPTVDDTVAAPSIFTGVRPATLPVRTIAWIIDVSVALSAVLVMVVVSFLTGITAVALIVGPVAVGALWIWFIAWHATTGNSFGKWALGLRLVSSTDAAPIGLGRTLLRALVLVFSVGTASLSIALDRSGWHRGWHDAAASAVVIDVLSGRNPLGPRVVTSVLRKPDRGLRSIESPVPIRTVAFTPTAAPPPPPPVAEL